MFLGIDLGTTNSAAVVFDGETFTPIRNQQGTVLTPSIVRIDARGGVTVGARARRFFDNDPDNTRGEFKRLMGSGHLLSFTASHQELRPEDLSAAVLRSIRNDVKDQLGFTPARAVVTVPALFELPQVSATAEAARLAGFAQIEVLPEPVASAIAAGWSSTDPGRPWLVYDVGGGTFDVSLLETQDGMLRVVGHDGDNFLGGRDFDTAILEYALERFESEHGLSLNRADPALAGELRRLRTAAEDAKIELTRAERANVTVPRMSGGHDLDVELSREEFERFAIPNLDRSVEICARLLATHGVTPDQLGRVVLVGGPTAMPVLRRRLAEALGAPFATGLDPMTLVARGAAIHAAANRIDARPPTEAAPAVPKGPRIWLQHPAIASDPAPWVVGRRVEGRDGPALAEVAIRRTDGEWESAREKLDAEGAFALPVALKLRQANTFELIAWRADGEQVVPEPARFSIVHGITLGDPPLSRSIGVALANNEVHVYFERGCPLPTRRSFVHSLVETVASEQDPRPGVPRAGGSDVGETAADRSAGYALKVPIVQGEFHAAHLCRLVGSLRIPAGELKGTLPAGTAIEVTLELDRGGRLSARAYIPALDQVFDRVAHLVTPQLGPGALEEAATGLRRRIASINAAAMRSGSAAAMLYAGELEARLGTLKFDLERAATGDPDALEKCRRLLLELDADLAEAESVSAWPEMVKRTRERLTHYLGLLSNFGTPVEKKVGEDTVQRIEKALAAKKAVDVDRQLPALRSVAVGAWLRHPGAWRREFQAVNTRIVECRDPSRARELVREGQKALEQNDDTTLERVTRSMWELLPVSAEQRKLGHDSGLV